MCNKPTLRLLTKSRVLISTFCFVLPPNKKNLYQSHPNQPLSVHVHFKQKTKMRVTHTIDGIPVPAWGSSIPDATLTHMLAPSVIGSNDAVVVTAPCESHSFLDFEPNLTSGRVEDSPLLSRQPNARHVFLAVNVSTATGRVKANDAGDTNGDHFVAVYLDVSARRVELMDSLPSKAVTLYLHGRLRVLALNVYGSQDVQLILIQPPCPRQDTGSNNCAVFVWANIAVRLAAYQYVPALLDLHVQVDDVDRDVFRNLFNIFYT